MTIHRPDETTVLRNPADLYDPEHYLTDDEDGDDEEPEA